MGKNEAPAEPTRPKLGNWCKVSGSAIRLRGEWNSNRGARMVKYEPIHYEKPRRMMYVGKRTVFNGWREWICDEVGFGFFQTEPVEVWLFVDSEHRNPIRVFPKQVMTKAKKKGKGE